MHGLEGDLDRRWSEPIELAARSLGDNGPGALVFYEEREDLTTALDVEGRSCVEHTRLSGVAVRGAFDSPRSRHRSNPEPDEAIDLAGSLARGGSAKALRSRTSAQEDGKDPLRLDVREALALLEAALGYVLRLAPNVRARASWVGHLQTVFIGRPERGVAIDRRAGGRLRLEASLPGLDQAAVVETAGRRPADSLEELARDLVERADCLRHRRAMTSGAWPVVFGPGTAGIVVHELVGHALEGDVLAAGQSWLARSQEGVAHPELRVIDDPRRGRAGCQVDDEGEVTRPVVLIGRGRALGRLDDLASGRASGRVSSGHGRRSSYREPVLPRMGCTFLAPGRLAPFEVFEGVTEGVYVRRLEAASTDPSTGRAVFRVADADRIRDGRREAPLSPMLLQLDAPSALLAIDRVASDLAFDGSVGSCVRDGQPLATSVGGPTCRLALANVFA